MFFIITSGQKDKKLEFDQMILCKNCDRYGRLEIYKVYSYLSIFFITYIAIYTVFVLVQRKIMALNIIDRGLHSLIMRGENNYVWQKEG